MSKETDMSDRSSDPAVRVRIAAWQGRCVDGDATANIEAAHRAIDAAGKREQTSSACRKHSSAATAAARSWSAGRFLWMIRGWRSLRPRQHPGTLVLLVGLSERLANGDLGNTLAIYSQGARLGVYRKTMLTVSDAREMRYCRDYDLPVFEARGVTFGCIICHDSSLSNRRRCSPTRARR